MKKNNNPMEKYKNYLIPIFLLLIFFAIIAFVLSPFVKKINEKFNQAQSKIVDSEIERDKINKLPEIKEQFKIVNDRRYKMEKVLFLEKDILALVQEMERIAEETENEINISVDDGKIDSKKNKAKAVEDDGEKKITDPFEEKDYFKIRMELIGDYSGLMKFMNRLSSVSYYNAIIGLKVAYQEEEPIAKSLVNLSNDNKTEPGENGVSEDEKRADIKSNLEVIFYLNSSENEPGKD